MRSMPSHLLLLSLALLGAPASALSGQEATPLERIESELESSPEDVDLLEQAARAAANAEDSDTALWYAKLARDQALADKRLKKKVKELDEFMLALAPPATQADSLLDEYAKEIFVLARTCERRKLYANAVDFLLRCRGTRFEQEANDKLAKLYDNNKVVEALIESGIDIPERPATKKDPAWIEKENAKHSDWSKAWEVEGKNYTIITNVGYEEAHLIHDTMDQMNQNLREIFQHKVRGGSMRRCVIKVYRDQKEFMKQENIDGKTTLGFFNFMQFYIATFDPRSQGGTLTQLWDTLFHEAAHQFKYAVTTNLLPGWGNEGMACYFEGARLLASGSVESNLVPESRLGSLLVLIEQDSPSLKETISYFQPGSYDGMFYPMGWGLTYYLLNYENDRSERVYLPIYKEWWETYTSGKNHDVFERWQDFFIKQAKVPGITNFEQFEAHWKQWIRDLGKLQQGGSEQADAWLARARKQRDDGHPEYALESFRRALDIRPDDPAALLDLARVQLALDQEDAGLFYLRRVWGLCRKQVDGEASVPGMERSWKSLAEEVVADMSKIDELVGKTAAAAGDSFALAMLDESKAVAEASFPRNALYMLEQADTVLGGEGRLEARMRELQSGEQVGLQRWRRLAVTPDLIDWQASPGVTAASGGSLELDTRGQASASTKASMPHSYRYELTLEAKSQGENPVFGLVLGSNPQSGLRILAYLPKQGVAGVFTLKGQPEQLFRLKPPKAEAAKSLRFAIEVEGRRVRFFLNDAELGSEELREDHVRGGVGVFVQDATALVREMRVRY